MEHLTIELARRLLSGHMAPAAQARWEAHVKTCARCRATLQAERNWARVLDLGDAATAEPAPPDEEPVTTTRLDEIHVRLRGRRRRRRLRLVVQGLAAALLAGLLVWQLVRETPPATTDNANLPISPDLQSRVIANLDALTALKQDPWLMQDYEAVQMLDTLIRSDRQ